MNESNEYKAFLAECVEKGRESLQQGKGKSAEEVFNSALKAILKGQENRENAA